MLLTSQHHSFDIGLAARYGIDAAIIIHHFQHWIRINRRNSKNIRDGKCWTYQSRKDIAAHFPYWTVEHVRRICEGLVEKGIIVTANYNKSPIDKTLWYAFADEEAFGVDGENSNNFYERQKCHTNGKIATSNGKIATPIPDTIKDTKRKIEQEDIAQTAEPLRKKVPEISFSFESKKFENISSEDIQSWKELCPSIDFDLEMKKMVRWCLDNPTKAKSKKRWGKFITNWLTRANEETINKQAYQSRKNSEKSESPELIEKNRKLANYVERAYKSPNFQVTASTKAIEFSGTGSCANNFESVNYDDPNFDNLVKHHLQKKQFKGPVNKQGNGGG